MHCHAQVPELSYPDLTAFMLWQPVSVHKSIAMVGLWLMMPCRCMHGKYQSQAAQHAQLNDRHRSSSRHDCISSCITGCSTRSMQQPKEWQQTIAAMLYQPGRRLHVAIGQRAATATRAKA